MTRAELLERVLAAYPFRARRPNELEARYLEELVAHLETRDFSAAHEIRVGRLQADWTPADVDAFREYLRGRYSRARHDIRSAPPVLEVISIGDFPPTEDSIRLLAERTRDHLADLRQADAATEIPILGTVLLLDGSGWSTIFSRGDRIATLKAIAKTRPLYGYVLGFDAFVHAAEERHATKSDAIIVHAGTRDHCRLSIVQKYTMAPAVVLEAPVVRDMRRGEPGMTFHDPYAEIFVSTPPNVTPQ